MLLLTQNQKMLLNLENLNEVYAHDGFVYAEDGKEDSRMTLGEYGSEERAKAILEEILTIYAKYIIVEGGPLITQDAYVQPMAYTPPKTYKMPEE